MTDNEKFITATNFIKDHGLGNFAEIADKIGVNRQKMDRLRMGTQKVTAKICKDLQRHYPQTKHIFEGTTQETTTNTNLSTLQKIAMLQDLVNTQKKLITTLEQADEHRQRHVAQLEDSYLTIKTELQNIRKQLTMFLSMLNSSPLPMWFKDTTGTMISLNKSYEKIFLTPLGKTAADYIGNDDFAIWPDDVARNFRENDQATIEQGIIDIVEPVTTPTGKKNWRIIKFVRRSEGKVLGVAGIAVPE